MLEAVLDAVFADHLLALTMAINVRSLIALIASSLICCAAYVKQLVMRSIILYYSVWQTRTAWCDCTTLQVDCT